MMKGIVLDADVKSGTGIICAENGERFDFKYENCAHKAAVLPSCEVEFIAKSGEAVEIYVLRSPARAKIDRLTWFLFSTRGRASRDQFFWFLAAISVAVAVLPVFALFVAAYAAVCVLAKRFHDTGRSMAWLFVFALFLGVAAAQDKLPAFPAFAEVRYVLYGLCALSGLFCLYLTFAQGNVGKNAYGDEPCKSFTKRLK